jgi:hypothetical protein
MLALHERQVTDSWLKLQSGSKTKWLKWRYQTANCSKQQTAWSTACHAMPCHAMLSTDSQSHPSNAKKITACASAA